MSTTYEPGKYQAKVLDQGFREAGTGTPGFYLQFKLLGRYDKEGIVQECQQYERTYNQWLMEETGVKILKGDLKILGVEVSDLTKLDLTTPGPISLVNRTIDVYCVHEMPKGRLTERWVLRPPMKKLDQNAIQILNEKFGSLLRGDTKPPASNAKPSDNNAPF
jgi:hypothetical protein